MAVESSPVEVLVALGCILLLACPSVGEGFRLLMYWNVMADVVSNPGTEQCLGSNLLAGI